jgi:thioesterase domain-containing protein/acyl carrier protein
MRRVKLGEWLPHFLRGRLPASAVPDRAVLEKMAPTPDSTINRQALRDPEPATQAAVGCAEPETPLERLLARLWEEVLQVGPISRHDNFFELGGHSLLAAQLIAEMEEAVGFRLPMMDLFQAPTIAEQAQLLRRERTSMPESALVPLRPGNGRPPLFCVHALFGGVFFFYDLVHHLDAGQPIYGLQMPGFESGRLFHERIEEMAAYYNQEIRRVQPAGPYFLCGFSLGGCIVFEMARQLEAGGQRVALVAILDTCVAQLPRFFDAPLPLSTRLRYRLWAAAKDARYHFNQLSALPVKEKSGYLLARVARRPVKRRAGGRKQPAKLLFPEGLAELEEESKQLPEHLKPLVGANLKAMESYVPQAYQGKVTLFRATGRRLKIYDPHAYGWAALAAGGVEVVEVPGNHLTLLKEPHVKFLADRLQGYLPPV